MAWIHHTLKCGSSERLSAVAVTPVGILAVGQHGMAVRSTDRGKTFSVVSRNPSGSLEELCVDAKTGRLLATTPVGTSAKLEVSLDGGGTWLDAELKSKTLSRNIWGDGNGVVLLSVSKPLSTYMRSVDGGVKWKKLTYEGYGATMTGDGTGKVYFATKNHVQVSTDNGETLGPPIPHPAMIATAGSALPSGSVWFVGLEGGIMHSADHGATWTKEESGTTQSITSVAAVDTDRAFATARGQLLERRGGAWQNADLAVEGSLQRVAFGDGLLVVVGQVFGQGPAVWIREL